MRLIGHGTFWIANRNHILEKHWILLDVIIGRSLIDGFCLDVIIHAIFSEDIVKIYLIHIFKSVLLPIGIKTTVRVK